MGSKVPLKSHLHLVALRLVIQVTAEKREKVVHFRLEQLRNSSDRLLDCMFRLSTLLRLTFFCSGSFTVSAKLVRALRIWAAAMLVEVFSKACSEKTH